MPAKRELYTSGLRANKRQTAFGQEQGELQNCLSLTIVQQEIARQAMLFVSIRCGRNNGLGVMSFKPQLSGYSGMKLENRNNPIGTGPLLALFGRFLLFSVRCSDAFRHCENSYSLFVANLRL